MADVVEGSTIAVGTVKFRNAAGRVLDTPLPTDATAQIDRADAGQASVALDGTNLTFTAGSVDGPVNVSATAGGFKSDNSVAENVVPDATPAGVVIVAA